MPIVKEREIIEKGLAHLADIFNKAMMEGSCMFLDLHGLEPEAHAEAITEALNSKFHLADDLFKRRGSNWANVTEAEFIATGKLAGFEATKALFPHLNQ